MKDKQKSLVLDISIVLTACALLFTVAFGAVQRRTETTPRPMTHILLDPGHGGDDGGAVAADGTLEKDINLSISLYLRDFLQVMGYRVSMTRTTDVMINTEGATLRERKVSDMKNRLAMSEAAGVTVSIHQNKFPQTQYFGTQIFYSANHPQSVELAQQVRASVLSLLQPENTRELKKGDSNVFLLSRATTPMILVECGFLSNETEREKLKDPAYQQRFAFALLGGILKGT